MQLLAHCATGVKICTSRVSTRGWLHLLHKHIMVVDFVECSQGLGRVADILGLKVLPDDAGCCSLKCLHTCSSHG